MSRSRRHTPIRGIAGHSEKEDKQHWHRAYRRAEKQATRKQADLMPHFREHSNPWSMAKDGKAWLPHWWAYGFGSPKKDMRK